MKPVTFPEVNVTYAENQPEYIPLPAHRDWAIEECTTTSCWKLGWRERLRVLFRGMIWHQQLTFKARPMPILLSVEKPKLRLGAKITTGLLKPDEATYSETPHADHFDMHAIHEAMSKFEREGSVTKLLDHQRWEDKIAYVIVSAHRDRGRLVTRHDVPPQAMRSEVRVLESPYLDESNANKMIFCDKHGNVLSVQELKLT